jgi:hypothetical protein
MTLIAVGCGGGGEDSSGVRGSCPPPDGVPAESMQVDVIDCGEASEVVSGYFTDGTVPARWTCDAYPGRLEAVQCFVGGCEPPADADPTEAQTTLAAGVLVKLSAGESERGYERERNCSAPDES